MIEPRPLAHSAPGEGALPQDYGAHVGAVVDGAIARADAMLVYAAPEARPIRDIVTAAASAHDLGKLDPDNQAALRRGRNAAMACDHVDAGVAHLMSKGDEAAAWLVRAHHAPGLPDRAAQFAGAGAPGLRGGRRHEGASADPDGAGTLIGRTDAALAAMVAMHDTWAGPIPAVPRPRLEPLEMRLALSCLVDADHEDTARFDGDAPALAPAPRWAERIAALDTYLRDLEPSGNAERAANRRAFYQACCGARPEGPIVACDGPVGIGKTTAVTAHLLRRAEAEGLRRLIVVAPWTNVISQTVDVLRRALVLDGEDPAAIVAEHHHRAEFETRAMRDLTATWKAPIVVTTAVQFFGTLSARHPASLRKLHALPGSAVFLDEAHAALPAPLWRQNWGWMRELAERWSCRFVLASGSLARFWNTDVVDRAEEIPDLVGGALRDRLLRAERRRVRYVHDPRREDTVESLCARVAEADGPRLVILNTVQGAALVAHALRERGHETFHISTALSPGDREPIIGAVHARLGASRHAGRSDWTLVATSCAEAGLDFSFCTAFRERWSAASLIQVGGRTNRNAVWPEGIVFDFRLRDERVPSHPGAEICAPVLGQLLREGRFDEADLDPAELVTDAMMDEVDRLGETAPTCGCWRATEKARCRHRDLSAAEVAAAYPCAAHLGEVISDETRMVVVDPALRNRLLSGRRVPFQDLVRGTVRLWPYRIRWLDLPPLVRYPGLHDWKMSYDPRFLGYMQGVIEHGQLTRGEGFIL